MTGHKHPVQLVCYIKTTARVEASAATREQAELMLEDFLQGREPLKKQPVIGSGVRYPNGLVTTRVRNWTTLPSPPNRRMKRNV